MTEFQEGDEVRYTDDIPMHQGSSLVGAIFFVRQVIVENGKEYLDLGNGGGGTKVGTYDWHDTGKPRFEIVSRREPMEDFGSVEDADRWLREHAPGKRP